MTLIRVDRTADTEVPARQQRGGEVLQWLLAGFASRSYLLIGPVCIWLPYPPFRRSQQPPPV